MLQLPSTMLVTPDNLQEFGRQFAASFGPLPQDLRQATAIVEGPLVSGRSELHVLRPGMRLIATDRVINCDVRVPVETEGPGMFLALALDAQCKLTLRHPDGSVDLWEFLPGRNMIGTFQADMYPWTVRGGVTNRIVQLQMDAPTAMEFTSEFCEVVSGALHPMLARIDGPPGHIDVPLAPELAVIVHQILRCPLEGPARRLFMESKALEMLAIHFSMLSSADLRDMAAPNRAERERLEEARRILDEEYSDPPSLLALARRVGLNDFKLKRGFKTLFDTTVYGYVRKVRMENALAMLQADAINVSEVAAATGYTSFGHFAGAFRKQFGIAPSSVKKARATR